MKFDIYEDMPVENIRFLAKELTSKDPAWRKLRAVAKARNLPSLVALRNEAERPLIPLSKFVEGVRQMQSANDKRFFATPAEWFLMHWTSGFLDDRETLPELVRELEALPKLKTLSPTRYAQIERWVNRHFQLSVKDFYTFFVTSRVPALEHLRKNL